MESVTQVQNLDKDVCFSLWANAHGKGINLSLTSYEKIEQTGILSLD